MDEYDLSGLDMGLGDLGNMSFSDTDLSGLDLNAINSLDFNDIGSLSDFSNASLDDLGLSGLGLEGLPSYEDLNLGDQAAINAMLGPDMYGQNLDTGNLEKGFNLQAAKDAEYQRYLDSLKPENQAATDKYVADLMRTGEQDLGVTDKNWNSYTKELSDQLNRTGGYTSDWQRSGSDMIQVRDDGSAIGINTETGDSYALNKNEVDQMVKNGQLNTFQSGYNTATGGDKLAPGGGKTVTLSNGQTGTLLPGGKIVDTNTGKVIGTTTDGKTVTNTTTNTTTKYLPGTNTTTGSSSKSGLDSLLPLLLALLAMNRGGGSSGSSAVIPALTATQRQTPYTQIQQAAGYRPGQGGITYFNPTQYTQKMAGGGIAGLDGGRLLDGPGDGVSDSIPAVIGGMAGGGQPARLARGEYVMDARTVAALGNGSTDAGAERLDQMRKRILADDRKAGVGKDSKAYRHLA